MIWVGVERVVEGKGGCGMRVEVEESEGVISRFVDSDYKCGNSRRWRQMEVRMR